MSAWLSDNVLRHVFLLILLLPPDWSDPAYDPPMQRPYSILDEKSAVPTRHKALCCIAWRSYVLKDILGEAIATTGCRRDTNVVETFDLDVAPDISVTCPFLEAYARSYQY